MATKKSQLLTNMGQTNDYVVNNNLAAFYLGRHFPAINEQDALRALEVLGRIKYPENSDALQKIHVALMQIVANQTLNNESEVQKEISILCPVEKKHTNECLRVAFKALSENLVMAHPNRSEIEERYYLGLAGYRIDPDIFYLRSMVIAMSELNIDDGYRVLTKSQDLPEFSGELFDAFCVEVKYRIDTKEKYNAEKYKKMCHKDKDVQGFN